MSLLRRAKARTVAGLRGNASIAVEEPTASDRRYPVGLTMAEIEALRTLLAKAEHAVPRDPTMPNR